MKTKFPGCSYDAILEMTNLPTVHDRRTALCRAYFNKMNRSNHKLKARFDPYNKIIFQKNVSAQIASITC